jgi:SAM-dependent methyltransferase
MASMKPLARGPHVTRYTMYQQLAAITSERPSGGRALSISYSAPLCHHLGRGSWEIVEGNAPEVDILALPYPSEAFDYVVSDQVLQHVVGNPQAAFDETRRVLKPGGWAIHTTCCVNPIVPSPNDLWRFTPEALAFLCRDFTRVVAVGGWGNGWIALVDWLNLRYEGVPESRWHPLHAIATTNDPDWPVHTWVVAEK